MTVVAVALVSAGVGFLVVSAIGLVRFPDFFARAHVVAKSETLGMMLIVSGIMFHHRFGDGTLRFVLLLALAMVANSTAIHALARAARAAGLQSRAPGAPGYGAGDDHGQGSPQ